jgi:superfamily II DNA or RNA helicase
MIARIVDNKFIHLHSITDHEDQVLWEAFSVSEPGTYIDNSYYSNWDGVYRKYNRARKRLARPLLGMLREVCEKHKLPLSVEDVRDPWKYTTVKQEDIDENFLANIKLEDYQINAIRSCIDNECGIVDVPTGGGKGELICGFCKAIQCPTLILADQRVVVKQLKERLELRDITDDVGIFYAGKRPDGQVIVVGLIQTLTANKKPPELPDRKKDETDKAYKKRLDRYETSLKAFKTRKKNVKFLNEYVKKAEMIIVDECDKAASESYKNLFRHSFQGRRRYGFSGTPFDPDKPVNEIIIKEHLGSIIYKEQRETILNRGRIVPITYNMLAFGLEGNPNEGSAYDIAYDEWIINNKKFHHLIYKLCAKFNTVGKLILVDRKNLGYSLRDTIQEHGIEAHFIHGDTPTKERDATLKRFERREFSVLIGGKIINRGLDLAGGCEVLILAGSNKDRSDLLQRVGRAFRRNELGSSKIYDFFFRCNRYLYDHSKQKLKIMVNNKFDTKVIFPGGVIDGSEFISKRFRVDKRLLGNK